MAGVRFDGTYTDRILLSAPTLQNPATLAATGIIDVATGDGIDGTIGSYWHLFNSGTTSAAAGLGVRLASGTVANGSQTDRRALVQGDYGGISITQGAGAVTNFGTIAGADGTGVSLQNGGTVLNSGTITGGAAPGAAVDIDWGVAPSTVVNYADGLISGTDVGVGIANGTITNFGTIQSTTTGVAGIAVNLRDGGLLNNYGMIRGAASPAAGVVAVHNEPGTIRNFGVIQSTVCSNAINLISGGTVVNGAPGSTAAQIVGGNAGIYVAASAYGTTPASLSIAVLNYGTIGSGRMAAIGSMAGGRVVNHGLISGALDGVAFRNQYAGTIINDGTIESDASGSVGSAIHLSGGGRIDNMAGALIDGVGSAILVAGGPATITNDGTIDGGAAAMQSIRLSAGGVIVNGQTGNTGALIASPQTGIKVVAGAATLINFGTIVGSGTAGIGVRFYGGDMASHTITNAGKIIGNGGTAIRLGGGYDTIVLEAGSILVGAITNMQPGDAIDLPFLSFVSAGAITPDADNVLQVAEGTASYPLHFDPAQNFTGRLFLESSDIAGGTMIRETSPTSDAVTPANQSVAYQQSLGLGSLFSVSGPAASRYQVWLDGPADGPADGSADGSVTDDNGAIATNTAVDETNLGNVDYIGGRAAGQDKLWARAYDGQWSSWALATLTDLGAVTATDQSVEYQQSVALSRIFSVNGPAPSGYEVWLEGPADGSVTDNNGAIATNQAVHEASLNGVNFTAGLTAGQDKLWVQTDYSSGSPSNWALATLTDIGAVTATNQSVGYQQSVALSRIFSVSGPTPSGYEVWLDGPPNGWVTDGSGTIATNTAVNETDLGSVNYIGGGVPGQDALWLRAFDGQWSSWALATLTDPGVTPSTVTPIQAAQTVPADTVIAASNLFTVSNNSAAVAQYGFWDVGTGGGHFTVGGTVQGTNQEIDEPAAQLSQVDYVAGTGTDTLWVRANDGLWGNWSSAFMVTG